MYQRYMKYEHITKGFTTSFTTSRPIYWRHFALTYNGTDYVTYLNGSVWTQSATRLESASVDPQPDKIYIGFLKIGSDNGRYHGTLACLIVYERHVLASEVPQIMKSCP